VINVTAEAEALTLPRFHGETAMKHAFFFLAVVLSSAAFAQMRGHDMGGSGSMQGMQGQGSMQMEQLRSALAEAEVRKVDKDAGRLTLRHGAIPGMDMPPMTMVYRVGNPAMLHQVKDGDKVMFAMEKVGGTLTVTRIELAR
jgi:Cu(I)/Ag(I) efflux system periplasmic protein CusF